MGTEIDTTKEMSENVFSRESNLHNYFNTFVDHITWTIYIYIYIYIGITKLLLSCSN